MSQTPPATTPKASLEGLTALLTQPTSDDGETSDPKVRRIPPLEKWSPDHCGEMDLTIKANGEWWHEGRKMTRQSMVDLFSSVLWAEESPDGTFNYFLKTPIEKIGIQVEDTPLLVTQVDTIEKAGKAYLEFSTPHGDKVTASDQHPIIFRRPHSASSNSPPQPYVLVRQNGESQLYGLIHRNVFFHLVNLGELEEIVTESGVQTQLTLHSGDSVFRLTMPNE